MRKLRILKHECTSVNLYIKENKCRIREIKSFYKQINVTFKIEETFQKLLVHRSNVILTWSINTRNRSSMWLPRLVAPGESTLCYSTTPPLLACGRYNGEQKLWFKWLRHKIIKNVSPVCLAKYIGTFSLLIHLYYFNFPGIYRSPWRIKEDSMGNSAKVFPTKEEKYCSLVCWPKTI
jgi:hypothetical protein